MSSDRNLLFGILAVQMNFISRDALIAAMNAWVLDKLKPLGDILGEHGHLAPEHRQLLDALVVEHLKIHDGRADRSLAALPLVESVKDVLASAVPDAEVQGTLALMKPQSAPATATHSGGTLAYDSKNMPPGPPDKSGSRYRILREHAKGGLGEVFVAEDTELHREVALKEIQGRHAHDENARCRFVLEAEITGGLEHPGIVPVYGLGNYADGRPYYAMRFIKGDSLKEAIDAFHLSPPKTEGQRNLAFRNLLKRFVDVCNAIAYAHSRGILHRDLKPSNVMLGKFGETLVVDWGLGKAIGRTRLRDRPEFDSGESTLNPNLGPCAAETVAGTAIGTPAFMSPEQAAGQLDDLGPASDVYSLGATLYVLLTGQAAFGGDIADLLRKVKRGDFTPPRQLRPDLPPALDAVVCKAMATHPADRYSSALALAADVEHFLADEPVSSYPEPLAMHVRRWGRRHRSLVAGLAVLLVTAVVGLGVGLYFVDAERDRTEEARRNETRQRAQAEKARDLARARFGLALNAFNEMVISIQNKLEARAGTQELRKELVEKARDGLKKLLEQAETEGNPDHTLVVSHIRMGDAYRVLGNTTAAHAEYLAGHLLAEQLVDVDPVNAQAQRDLSISCDRLGDVKLQMGQTKEAVEQYRRALQICQRLADAEPKNAQAQRDLSIAYERLGDALPHLSQTAEAEQFYQKSSQIRQRLADADPRNTQAQRDLSLSHDRLGDAMLRLNQPREALGYFQKGLDVRQRLADADPKNVQAQRDLSVSFTKVGDVTLQLNRPKYALDLYGKGLKITRSLADADPKNVQAQRDLGISYDRLGDVSLRLNQTAEALDFYQKGLQVCQRLADEDPENAQAQRDLSTSLNRLGDLTLKAGRPKEALEFFQKGLPVRQRLADADPNNAQAQRDLSVSLDRVGDVTLQLGEPREALEFYQKSSRLLQHLADLKFPQSLRDLSINYDRLGEATLRLGPSEEGFDYYLESLRLRQGLAEADPDNPQAHADVFVSHFNLGSAEKARHEYARAADWFTKGREALLPWHEKGVLTGQFKNAVPVIDREITACRIAAQACARLEFAFEQKPENVTPLVEARLGSLLARNQLADAVATAERFATWADQQEKDRNDRRYSAAGFFSRCAGIAAGDKDKLAIRAVASLRKAQAEGYFDVKRMAQLKQDRDLDPLRQREDFKQFLQEVEAANKKK